MHHWGRRQRGWESSRLASGRASEGRVSQELLFGLHQEIHPQTTGDTLTLDLPNWPTGTLNPAHNSPAYPHPVAGALCAPEGSGCEPQQMSASGIGRKWSSLSIQQDPRGSRRLSAPGLASRHLEKAHDLLPNREQEVWSWRIHRKV